MVRESENALTIKQHKFPGVIKNGLRQCGILLMKITLRSRYSASARRDADELTGLTLRGFLCMGSGEIHRCLSFRGSRGDVDDLA